jgi:hypothetical protein
LPIESISERHWRRSQARYQIVISRKAGTPHSRCIVAHRTVTLSAKRPVYDDGSATFPRSNPNGTDVTMRRRHRQAHRLIWPVLAAAVLVLAMTALMVKPSGDPRAMVGVESQR